MDQKEKKTISVIDTKGHLKILKKDSQLLNKSYTLD